MPQNIWQPDLFAQKIYVKIDWKAFLYIYCEDHKKFMCRHALIAQTEIFRQ